MCSDDVGACCWYWFWVCVAIVCSIWLLSYAMMCFISPICDVVLWQVVAAICAVIVGDTGVSCFGVARCCVVCVLPGLFDVRCRDLARSFFY